MLRDDYKQATDISYQMFVADFTFECWRAENPEHLEIVGRIWAAAIHEMKARADCAAVYRGRLALLRSPPETTPDILQETPS
ncbi:thiopurine S-methyltransferase [Roseibium sp. TrichSKD4]|nr:thiopurine S-methyltransferase [Roseibium sp. TrichSKD4]